MFDLLRRVHTRRLAVAIPIAAALGLAPCAARAFCRTTTSPVPATYSPTRGCYTEGLPLFWKGACISYSINRRASATIALEQATSVIDASFASWNAVTCADTGALVGIQAAQLGPVDCGEIRFNSIGPNQNTIVFRDDGWPYSDPNSTLGLTTVTFNATTGELLDADMEINASGKNLSTSELVPSNGFDLGSVVTHEAGHFLGLAHATDSRSTMFASYRPGTSALRTLAADDVAGICEIYPDATQRRVQISSGVDGVVEATLCDATPKYGFSTSCSANPTPPAENSTSCAVPRVGASSGTARLSGAGALAVVAAALIARARRRRRM